MTTVTQEATGEENRVKKMKGVFDFDDEGQEDQRETYESSEEQKPCFVPKRIVSTKKKKENKLKSLLKRSRKNKKVVSMKIT